MLAIALVVQDVESARVDIAPRIAKRPTGRSIRGFVRHCEPSTSGIELTGVDELNGSSDKTRSCIIFSVSLFPLVKKRLMASCICLSGRSRQYPVHPIASKEYPGCLRECGKVYSGG